MTLFDPKSIQVLGADSNGNNVILCTMYVDTIADLPAQNAFTGNVLSMGCRAIVINDNSVHRLNSAGQWVQITAGTATYTKTEIDSMIARIDATEAEDRASLIAQVDGGAKNLFDIQHPSTIRDTSYNVTSDGGIELSCTNATWTQYRVANTPVESGRGYAFTLYVDAISGTNTFRIYIRDNNESGNLLYDSNSISTVTTLTTIITPNTNNIWVGIYLNNSATAKTASAKIRAMLCTKSVWDISHTYVPYGKTNAELTAENNSQQSEIDYAVNTGVKNLLKITASSQTHKGVTFTVNDDQTVTVNGTNDGTGASAFVIVPNEQAITIPDGNYILSGCPTGGGASVPFDLRWYMYSSRKSAYDSGNGALIEKSGNTEISNIAIVVKTGQTANNLIFKPMIRPAAITDPTYEPYAPTNRELYDMIRRYHS